MNDPVRLRDDPTASDAVRSLLAHAQPPSPVPASVAQTILQRAAATAAMSATGVGLSLGAKWGIGIGIAGVIAAGAVTWQLTRTPSSHTEIAKPAVSTAKPATTVNLADAASAAPAIHNPPVIAAQPTLIVRDAGAITAAPDAGPLVVARASSHEVELLESARTRIATAPDEAIAMLDAHTREFPTSTLRQEREVLYVRALRRSGRTQDARDRAEAFLRANPDGIYSSAMRQLLEARP